ncbi:hypothetical protein Q9L58_009377 [Maublancomyces gigas]|uniref:Uncharacterized protein n=1 Tax=Discina gigas TaxID=1032678 RepID=A0ABR3G7F9_9PEZI
MSGPSGNAPSGPMEIPNFTIPEGSGWSKSPRKLARHGYFARGEGICKLLEDHGYGYIYPVMMDEYNTYLIRGMTRERKLIYFVWNPIADTIFKAVKTDVQEIVEIMGRSVLALDVVDLESVVVKQKGGGVDTQPADGA